MSRKRFLENTRQLRVVQNDQIGIVLLDIVVLPALVPPAESNHRRPAIREQTRQRILGPLRRVDIAIVQVASKLSDKDRFVRR